MTRIRPRFDRRAAVLLSLLVAMFLAMQFVYGIRIAPDSGKYIKGSPLVGPVYPLFLDLFEGIFGASPEIQGQPAYIFFAVLFQNLFVAYAIFSLIECFLRRANLRLWEGCLLGVGFAASFLVQTALTVEGRIASNTIMSEGLAFPLYFLLFKYLYLALADKSRRAFALAAAMCFLLTGCRGQLLWLVPLMFFAFLWMEKHREGADALVAENAAQGGDTAQKKRLPRRLQTLLLALLLTAVYFGASALLTRGYNLLHAGEATGNTLGRRVLLAAVLYVSDEEDADLFPEGSSERALFTTTYAGMKEKKLRYADAGRGLVPEFNHYEFACDPVQILILNATIRLQGVEDKAIDAGSLHMILALAFDNLPLYLRHCLVNATGGVVRSAALFKPVFIAFAAAVYLCCIAAILYGRKTGRLPVARRFLKLCLVCILANAVFSSFGVWCLSRYMFYNLPVLYMGVYLALHELLSPWLSARVRPKNSADCAGK